MCGRTACTLEKQGIQHATCMYSQKNAQPKWFQKYQWQNYHPSFNLAPGAVSPVLVSDYAVTPKEACGDIYAMPMRWGLVPSWHKGSLKDFPLKTNNCRYEGILEKPTYKGAFAAGRRCVILADGFYEWKANGKGKKQPYFIYFPQKDGFNTFITKPELTDEENIITYEGPRLLTMAGVFDMWSNPEEGNVLYSYSVITLDSSKKVSFVHSRMPAILDGSAFVNMWLDSKNVPMREAISVLKPIDNLEMHPVSTEVNFSGNNSINCFLPLKEEESKPIVKKTALTSWLISSKKDSDSPAKRFKSEVKS